MERYGLCRLQTGRILGVWTSSLNLKTCRGEGEGRGRGGEGEGEGEGG